MNAAPTKANAVRKVSSNLQWPLGTQRVQWTECRCERRPRRDRPTFAIPDWSGILVFRYFQPLSLRSGCHFLFSAPKYDRIFRHFL